MCASPGACTVTLVTATLREARLPAELIQRCQRHLTAVLLHRRLAFESGAVLNELSAPLRAEVALHRCHKVVLSPKFMEIVAGDGGSLDPAFIKELVMRLELVAFAEADYAIEARMRGRRSPCPARPPALHTRPIRAHTH
jgi:hypothetical protein